MQQGRWKLSMWAGCALLSALAAAPAHAAPQAQTDATDATPDDNNDTHADAINALPANTPPQNTAPAANPVAITIAGPGPGKATSAPPAPMTVADRDIGRSVREISKPLLEELTHSDVAEAVRALDARPDSADSGLGNAESDANGRDPAARRRNWDGTGQKQAEENNAPSNGPRDPERDKARASVLLSGLINEIKPWAAGAAVLYVLGYVAKFGLAARRRNVQRRMERRKQRARHSRRGRL